MEYAQLEINWNSETAVRIRFPPRLGQTLRTAYGFRIDVPIELNLRPIGSQRLVPIVSGLRARLFFVRETGEEIEVGALEGPAVYSGSAHPAPYTINHVLTWTGPLTALLEFDTLRNGRPPHFRVRLCCEVAVQLPSSQPGLESATVPKTVSAQGDFEYPAELWRDALLRLRLSDIVMIEIPSSESPPDGFEPVWSELKHARDVFYRGGSFSWGACAAAVRNAIQHWENIEPSTNARNKGGYPTKHERLLQLRKDLKLYMSYGLHPEEDGPATEQQWTRDDALLGITGLAALLAVRKP